VGARYGDDLELLGFEIEPREARPGDRVRCRYHWRAGPAAKPDRYAVFVHFRAPRIVFQDDHDLLADLPAAARAFRPREEVFVEERAVAVPDSAPPGDYAVAVGLLRKSDGMRLIPRTASSISRRSVVVPNAFRVAPRAKP
jgi:hypothetical protein